ncbi:TPA: hypothetical protein N0F65_012646 [Lagenidium giganteum]|uniref:Uncharacterized protein n=1 Tax=Lagenidium giganteum TaxID=4803 RepID=A0AAV2YNJ5_9STRA|nr:TPA: hypothetical protein N0F65_012646 [Lagenidium giganteum]
MDPLQAQCYSRAQVELQELFREISEHGQVTQKELKTRLLPFTAGDAKRDLEELIDEVKHRHQALNEQDFVRVMWKKMYLSHVIYASKNQNQRPSGSVVSMVAASGPEDAASDDTVWNIPLSHVIVSIKRRSQMKQFAHYYASRGITGADHLTSEGKRSPPRNYMRSSPILRKAITTRSPQHGPITALRHQNAAAYELVAIVYDGETRRMESKILFTCQKSPLLTCCSPFYCMAFIKTLGNYVFGSSHFMLRLHQQWKAYELSPRRTMNEEEKSLRFYRNWEPPPELISDTLFMKKLDDTGLRNTTTASVSTTMFTACTERRIYQWTLDAEPIESNQASTPSHDRRQNVIPVHPHNEGDCFGFIGGTKLAECPKNFVELAGVRELGSGMNFVIALNGHGELYSWGDGAIVDSVDTPCRILPSLFQEQRILKLSCGAHHVLVTSEFGIVFGFGSNAYGQLGIGPPNGKWSSRDPVQIPLPAKQTFVDVACGSDHSIVLGTSGQVWAFGNNWHGQLGFDPVSTDSGCVYDPTLVVQLKERAYLICANQETTAMATETGKILTCGRCIPSGIASVCGLVAKWELQAFEVSEDKAACPESKTTSPSKKAVYSCVARVDNGKSARS